MIKVIVAGGGWSGCAAALAAQKAGADVTLLERTDMLLGTGLVGGIYRNNGRFTAAEECIALGGGELFYAMDSVARHTNLNFPGHYHASLYDVNKVEPVVKRILEENNIQVRMQARVVDVERSGEVITAVELDDDKIKGDVFVDATGSAGPMGNCLRYGNGCAMCVLRCPSFGPRVSVTGKAGIKETVGLKADGTYGAMSGSCKLAKESLSPTIFKELETKGKVVITLSPSQIKSNCLGKKACSQYAIKEYAENIVLLDTGHAKLMTSFYPLEELRKISGLETARYVDPYSGSIGNSMRYMSIAPRSNDMKVEGIQNLFCGGEKSGIIVGHTEAIVTGLLAGHNAVRHAMSLKTLEFPEQLACGDYIGFVQQQMQTKEGMKVRYTFSGSVYFERMKQLQLYTTDQQEIRQRVERAGLLNIFAGQPR